MCTNFVLWTLYCYRFWWHTLHCMLGSSLGGVDHKSFGIWCTHQIGNVHNGVGWYLYPTQFLYSLRFYNTKAYLLTKKNMMTSLISLVYCMMVFMDTTSKYYLNNIHIHDVKLRSFLDDSSH